METDSQSTPSRNLFSVFLGIISKRIVMHIISPNSQLSPVSQNPEPRGEENPLSHLPDTLQQESTTQQGSTSSTSNDEYNRRVELVLSNPIMKNIRDQELGKLVLGVSVTVTTAFTVYFFYKKSTPSIVTFVIVLLSMGCAAIFNGLLLRDYYPLTAAFMEVVGIAIIFLAVHGIVGAFLPPYLRWISGLIGISTVAPFIIAATNGFRTTISAQVFDE